MSEADQMRLIEGLRDAVAALYNCRYSEQPLAKRLDGLLGEITGKTNFDIVLDKWKHDASRPSPL
jgi:hypothetical protein